MLSTASLSTATRRMRSRSRRRGSVKSSPKRVTSWWSLPNSGFAFDGLLARGDLELTSGIELSAVFRQWTSLRQEAVDGTCAELRRVEIARFRSSELARVAKPRGQFHDSPLPEFEESASVEVTEHDADVGPHHPV